MEVQVTHDSEQRSKSALGVQCVCSTKVKFLLGINFMTFIMPRKKQTLVTSMFVQAI